MIEEALSSPVEIIDEEVEAPAALQGADDTAALEMILKIFPKKIVLQALSIFMLLYLGWNLGSLWFSKKVW